MPFIDTTAPPVPSLAPGALADASGVIVFFPPHLARARDGGRLSEEIRVLELEPSTGRVRYYRPDQDEAR